VGLRVECRCRRELGRFALKSLAELHGLFDGLAEVSNAVVLDAYHNDYCMQYVVKRQVLGNLIRLVYTLC